MSRKVRFIFLLLSIAVFLWSAWKLTVLPLWEYWSLAFLSSLWAIVLLLIGMRKQADSLVNKRLMLSTLSGVLLALSFPPFPFPFLAFVGFIPLMTLWYQLKVNEGASALKKFRWYAYNTFVVWNILLTFWVSNSALLPGIFAIWVNSLFMMLPFLFAAWGTYKLSTRWHLLLWVVPWIAFEYGHLNWELSWPWLTLGHTFASAPSLVQWYSITGALGGSVWILTLNFQLTQIFFLRKTSGATVRRLAVPALLLVLPIILNMILYRNYDSVGVGKVNFSIIQPNYEPHYKKFELSPATQLGEIVDLMSEAVTDSTEYVLLPETVFDNVELTNFDNEMPVRRFKAWLKAHEDKVIVMGLSSYTLIDKAEKGKYTREIVGRFDTLYYQSQNSAVIFDGSQKEEYFKSKFVPGAEIFPYSKFLFFFKPLVDMLGGSIVGFEPQAEAGVFTIGSADIAPLICYESIYPEYGTSFIRNGAEVVAIMTNDGWWGDTFGYRQHNAYARILAIELGRDIVRSANSGISSVINARGDLLKATKYDERTYLNATVTKRNTHSLYVRTGDIVGKVSLALLIMLSVVMILRRK